MAAITIRQTTTIAIRAKEISDMALFLGFFNKLTFRLSRAVSRPTVTVIKGKNFNRVSIRYILCYVNDLRLSEHYITGWHGVKYFTPAKDGF